MLPRTARAGLLARRQFSHSSIQLAASGSSKIVKASTSLKLVSKVNDRPKEKQKQKEPSAEKIAHDALMHFFRSSPPAQLKSKAAQARHYGTLSAALRQGILFSEEANEKKQKGDDAKASKPATSESHEERVKQKERIDEATDKEGATDKMKEEPKDDKEVSYQPADIKYC